MGLRCETLVLLHYVARLCINCSYSGAIWTNNNILGGAGQGHLVRTSLSTARSCARRGLRQTLNQHHDYSRLLSFRGSSVRQDCRGSFRSTSAPCQECFRHSALRIARLALGLQRLASRADAPSVARLYVFHKLQQLHLLVRLLT
jgi:hypothetical protein